MAQCAYHQMTASGVNPHLPTVGEIGGFFVPTRYVRVRWLGASGESPVPASKVAVKVLRLQMLATAAGSL